jgi:thiol-disulfide isomerase/thioredoxin
MTSLRTLRSASGFLLFAAVAIAVLVPRSAASDEPVPTLDLGVYRGKVVIVDFWASWCVPCRRSFPWLDAMQRKYGEDGLVVIGINEDNVAEDAVVFLKAVPVSFRIVRDKEGALAREFGLTAMPSSYVIGRDGKVAVRHLGFKSAKQDEYEETLRRLLQTGIARIDTGGVEAPQID